MDTFSKPEVYFRVYYQNGYSKTYLAEISENEPVFSGIEIGEFSKVTIKLVSEEEDTKIKLQLRANEKPVVISANSGEITILSGGNNEEMLVPGQYLFEVLTPRKSYKAFYNIVSSQFSSEDLLNLKKYLDHMVKGLIYELNKRKYGSLTLKGTIQGSLIHHYEKFEKNKVHLLTLLEDIIKNPLQILTGEYQKRLYTKRPDLKSVRWQVTKGRNKGGTAHFPLYYNEKHTKLSVENIENLWIKYIINEIINIFEKINHSLLNEKQRLNHRKLIIMNNIKEKRIQEHKLSQNKYGFKLHLNKIRSDIKVLEDDYTVINEEIQSISEFSQSVKWWINRLGSLKENSWLNKVQLKKPRYVPYTLMRDYRYKKIYDYYQDIYYSKQRDQSELDQHSRMFRKTWELFEYYTVGLVIDILQELGYKWISGWLADYDDLYLESGLGSLPSNTLMLFESPTGTHYIELAYDYSLEQKIQKKSNKGQYISQRGRRPDIRLTILEENKAIYTRKSLQVRAGLIIEVKYRNHKYLLDQNFNPDVKEQLVDFTDLRYYDPKIFSEFKEPIEPVKQVIVVYPKQKGQEPFVRDFVYGNQIVYLQISPVDPESDDIPFGYDTLKDRIKEFLNQIQ